MTLRTDNNHSSIKFIALAASIMLLTACGGGGSGGSSSSGGGSGGSGGSAVTTQQAQTAAANSLSKAINANGSSLTALGTTSPAIGTVTNPLAGAIAGAGSGVNSLSANSQARDVFDDLDSFINATFGLDGAAATVTRTGDTVTIDPDENTLCTQDVVGTVTADTQLCVDVVSRLLITIAIASADSGTVTYSFDGNALFAADYSPNSATFRFNLASLLGAAESFQAIVEPGAPFDAPEVFTGVFSVTGTVLNDTEGAEAGSFSLDIEQAIDIQDTATSTSFALAASQVFSVTSDAGAGTAQIDIGLGAINAVFPVEDSFGNPSEGVLSWAGLTGTASLTNNGNSLAVTNIGIGGLPLSFTVGGAEALELVFDTMGLTVDGVAETISLDGALNFDLSITNVIGVFEDEFGSNDPNLTATLGLDAPDGTQLTALLSDILRVDSGSVSGTGTGLFEGSFLASPGQCLNDTALTPIAIEVVTCPL